MLSRSGRSRTPAFLIPFALTALASAAASMPRPAQSPEPRVIELTARRFAFEPAEIEVAAGEPVVLEVKSADGVHGIEIKRFKVKREIPQNGESVRITFTPNAAGRFPIVCSEYCGRGHADMKGTLVVRASEATAP